MNSDHLLSSTTCYEAHQDDLQELQNENINVWGREQESLESQALEELRIFQKDNKKDADINKEDGELSDGVNAENSTDTSKNTFNFEGYLKTQEDLKKRQEHLKSLKKTVDKNLNIANCITGKLKKTKTAKRKRKDSKESKEKVKLQDNKVDSDSDYIPSDLELTDNEGNNKVTENIRKKKKTCDGMVKAIDDGDPKLYKKRLDKYYSSLEESSGQELIKISHHLQIQAKTWNNLYGYQKRGVEWLWGLHKQPIGGILGDEMGLGKTVQVIAFLSALNNSRVVSSYCKYTSLGPTIIACPTTVIQQWVQHFHEWAPEIRVAILHNSGSFTGNQTSLIKEMFKNRGIIITSYFSILKYKKLLVDLDWHYLILDEGHKIRNPSAKITAAVKEFRTPHKLILSGSPMQNNLQELWSLFDFACPRMLGTLPVFLEHFATPIIQGGYHNATAIQEATALEMATLLKDMISPYLLRRCKMDLKSDISLPQKTEQVLFCSLSDEQRELYKGFLRGAHVENILNKGKNWYSENRTRAQVLLGITLLRKICNHPEIYLNNLEEVEGDIGPETDFDYKRSGKMVVVSALLKIWKKQKHKVLLFTQGRAMVEIFERFLLSNDYKYLKMDGSTSVKSRQSLISTFNEDASYDVFLLTTRVGGLGVNLTGADRVIIYDPDWNPATDTQARERAWRIGQDKQVTIYRLISAGTIEEKIYQRQVWKQLLSNKILLDPRTQKFFTTSDLHDLFSLQEPDNAPETENIFKNARVSLQEKLKEKKSKKKSAAEEIKFSDDAIEKMRNLARAIAKNIVPASEAVPKKKHPHEIEEEMEKKHRQAEKEYMKTLTPKELIDYNRQKLTEKPVSSNKVDDFNTDVSFSKAMEICEETSKIYHKMKRDKIDTEKAQDKYESLTKGVIKETENKIKRGSRKVDTSGKVDGEKVDSLIKTETVKVKQSLLNESQNDYVLEKLFSKKGIHSALQHDMVVDSSKERPNKFRVLNESQMKTEQALQALTRSRFQSWH